VVCVLQKEGKFDFVSGFDDALDSASAAGVLANTQKLHACMLGD
jgi:hypothetical protein